MTTLGRLLVSSPALPGATLVAAAALEVRTAVILAARDRRGNGRKAY